MRLGELARPAMLLVAGMCIAGAAALTWYVILPPPTNTFSALVYLTLAFLIAGWQAKIHPRVASISPGFVLVFAALFHCGTVVAVAAAAINSLASHVLRPREAPPPSLWTTAYNAACLGLAAFAAGALRDRVIPLAEQSLLPAPELLGAMVAVVVYYAGSVLALGVVSTLHHTELPPKRWWFELLALAPVYLAGGAIAFVLDSATELLLLGLPLAYLIHRFNANQAGRLREEVERRKASEKIAGMYLSVVETLSNAIDMKDHGTHSHVQRVHALAKAVGERMGLTGDELEAVRIGAVLHDIGKLAVPDSILRKPGRLTAAELELAKQHPAAGEAILRPIDFGVPVASIVRSHHEKLDGSGYPDGLRGHEIPLGARVLAVIDVYDALVSARPYRKAWTSREAVAQLRREAGSKLDAYVVEALAAVLEMGGFEGAKEPEEGLAGPMPHLIRPNVVPLGIAPDAVLAGQVAEAARRCVLHGLVHHLAQHGIFVAAVAYDLDAGATEIDAVAAAGDGAAEFALARIALGGGVSGAAAQSGQETSGLAAEDFGGFSDGVPYKLRDALAVAIPAPGADGSVLAVVALYYSSANAELVHAIGDELRTDIDLIAHQLQQIVSLAARPESDNLTSAQLLAEVEDTAGGA